MRRFKKPSRESWNDSVYHYYTHVGIRNRIELYWRVFAYEVLHWPDGLKPRP